MHPIVLNGIIKAPKGLCRDQRQPAKGIVALGIRFFWLVAVGICIMLRIVSYSHGKAGSFGCRLAF
jgi:hypothetical protein